MKKIINGKKYDTETAQCIGSISSNEGDRLFEAYEGLYRKKTGEFFLFCSGGPGSKFGKQTGHSNWSGDEFVRPLTYEEAAKWAETNLDGDEYEAIFGEVDEGEQEAAYVSVNVTTQARDALRQASSLTGEKIAVIATCLILEGTREMKK